jgi:hypothetical protein
MKGNPIFIADVAVASEGGDITEVWRIINDDRKSLT